MKLNEVMLQHFNANVAANLRSWAWLGNKGDGKQAEPLGPGFENQAQCPRSGGEEGGAHLTHGHAGQTGADPEEQVGAGIG